MASIIPVDLTDLKAAKKKFVKHFKGQKDLQQLTKTLKKDVGQTKSIIQLMNEQILSNKQSNWKGYEILFYLPITSKKRAMSNNKSPSAMVSDKDSNKNHDRYLFLVKRPDSAKDIVLLKVINKDSELDIRNSYDIKHLHSVDYGSEELDLVLSLDTGDYSLYFVNQLDRDEFTWILASIAKSVVGTEFSIGYSIDFESLTYMMTTSGTMTKFPQLSKIISVNNTELGYQFSNDEAEAEHILDELNWSNSVTSLTEIHNALSEKSSRLNDEIIDFLLQWEEMDNTTNESQQHRSSRHNQFSLNEALHNPAATVAAAAATVANIGNTITNVANSINPVNFVNNMMHGQLPVGSTTSQSFTTTLQDTGDVLAALNDVDRELSSVENWLEEQIHHLSEIQSNLFLIEDQSAALETSWQSLNRVQEVITLLMAKYTLTSEQERILRSPDLALTPILKATSLTSAQLYREHLLPLVEAARILRQALVLKLQDDLGLKASEWKQIQAISAIAGQKQKFQEIAQTFCLKMGELSISLFDWLLKHRSLVEGERLSIAASSTTSSTTAVLIPKQFPTKHLLDDLHLHKLNLRDGVVSTPTTASIHLVTESGSYYINPNRFRYGKNNLLIQSQELFHVYVVKFIPLLELLMDLAPRYSKILSEAYRNAVRERLYSPLLKAFVKDVKSHINYLQPPINFTTCKGFRVQTPGMTPTGNSSGSREGLLQVTFNRTTNANKQITTWKALELVLLLLVPVIDHEEAFLKKLFHLGGEGTDGNSSTLPLAEMGGFEDSDSKPNLEVMMSSLFETFLKRIYSLSAPAIMNQSTTDIDGIEAIALLTVLNQFLTAFTESISQWNLMNVKSSNPDQITGGEGEEDEKREFGNNYGNNNSYRDARNQQNTESELYALQSSNMRVFLMKSLHEVKHSYEQRIHAYKLEQIKWIQNQKVDAKSPLVLTPFYRYPTLVLQICEMSNGEKIDCVDDLIYQIAKEMISWLNLMAKANEKYADKVKIINYLYFHLSVTTLIQYYRLPLTILQPFLTYALQQVQECSQRYLRWMIEYEFSSLSALAIRLEGVGSRVSDDELSLYIRRKDVLNVIKELEGKTLESMVINLKKRLEKHFRSEFDTGLNLTVKMWEELKERMVNIFTKLEAAASVSYQIKLDIGPRDLMELFEKHRP